MLINPETANMAMTRKYRTRQIIFHEGEAGEEGFLVQQGRVELFQMRENGRVHVGTIGPGTLFGELSLIDLSHRMASARAVVPTTCLVIDQQHFDRKLRLLTEAQRRIYEEILGFVRATVPADQSPADASKTPAGLRMRKLCETPRLLAMVRSDDTFLNALSEILLNYVDRRLPPR